MEHFNSEVADEEFDIHSEEVHDIITDVPPWILRWGLFLVFCIVTTILIMAEIIRYPDVVDTQLTINSTDSPKPIVAKISGRLIKLLVKENQIVDSGQPLAYLESTGNHVAILNLLSKLRILQNDVLEKKPINPSLLNISEKSEYGELQSGYQSFFQEYLMYKSSITDGYLLHKKAYLQKDLHFILQGQQQLVDEKTVEKEDYRLAKDQYDMHKKLEEEKVETPVELRDQESKLLSKKSPLIQTESAIISAQNNYSVKQAEILELQNEIQEETGKFLQALNSLISATEDWKNKYVLESAQSGKITFAGIMQENQVVTQNQEVFYVNPGTEKFFGQMILPQSKLGKVQVGQLVLIKLQSYPFEEYGMLTGKIENINDVPLRDSLFLSRVHFHSSQVSDLKKKIRIRQGMIADAEIITEEASIIDRLTRNFKKMLHN